MFGVDAALEYIGGVPYKVMFDVMQRWEYVGGIPYKVMFDVVAALEYVGGIPYDILAPVFDQCTVNQLLNIEDFNPVRSTLTGHQMTN